MKENSKVSDSRDLVLVGNPQEIHVGAHLASAAEALGVTTSFCDTRAAFGGPAWYAKMSWHLRGHRPSRLSEFSQEVVRACEQARPRWLLTVGLAPVNATSLVAVGKLSVRRLNYLTDDPWNSAHRSTWIQQALPHYDRVFSPRCANLLDLVRLGCSYVSYLPFAYSPDLHFPEPPMTDVNTAQYASDVVFVGGADPDRVPYLDAIIRSGYQVGLYGGNWERYNQTFHHNRGYADPRTLRLAVGAAKVALVLGRRANRDGHAMRTFEVAAIGACMLVEDTSEHREIFGDDGKAVVYFDSISKLIERLRWLLDHESDRHGLALAAHRIIVGGRNTYRDRLESILGIGLGNAEPDGSTGSNR